MQILFFYRKNQKTIYDRWVKVYADADKTGVAETSIPLPDGRRINDLIDIRFDPPNDSRFEIHGLEFVKESQYGLTATDGFYQQFNLIKLPYIWGTYDADNAALKTKILEEVLDNPVELNANKTITLRFSPDFDKSSGNYIHLRVRAPENSTLTIAYGDTGNSKVFFELIPSDHLEDYLVRISSQWEWMSQAIDSLLITSTGDLELENVWIRKGD